MERYLLFYTADLYCFYGGDLASTMMNGARIACRGAQASLKRAPILIADYEALPVAA
jgi:hypothetical protein